MHNNRNLIEFIKIKLDCWANCIPAKLTWLEYVLQYANLRNSLTFSREIAKFCKGWIYLIINSAAHYERLIWYGKHFSSRGLVMISKGVYYKRKSLNWNSRKGPSFTWFSKEDTFNYMHLKWVQLWICIQVIIATCRHSIFLLG